MAEIGDKAACATCRRPITFDYYRSVGGYEPDYDPHMDRPTWRHENGYASCLPGFGGSFAAPEPTDLGLRAIHAVNVARAERWHPGFPGGDWTGGDWAAAMCGEAGEAANVVKKLRRLDIGANARIGVTNDDCTGPELRAELGEELADTLLYIDLLAAFYGIDLVRHVVGKFNRVSDLQGWGDLKLNA